MPQVAGERAPGRDGHAQVVGRPRRVRGPRAAVRGAPLRALAIRGGPEPPLS